MKPLISPKDAIAVLNRALEADRKAIRTIFACRAPCNQLLADDPTIQVSSYQLLPGSDFSVGALGLLNGLFGIRSDKMGYLCAVYEVECPVHGVERSEFTKVGEPCSIEGCGRTLHLGELVRFKETPEKS